MTSATRHRAELMYDLLTSVVRALSWADALQRPVRFHQQHPFSADDPTQPFLPATIPGGSPLRFCNESRATDLYQIDHIELYPKPLHIDDVFEVHLYGTFLQNITTNATWTMSARGINSTETETGVWDFCHAVDSIEQPDPGRRRECPPEKGFALVKMSGWVMPMYIVPGTYYFRFDAKTEEGQQIYCLESEIHLDYRDKDKDSAHDHG
ncbi:MAG: hypothetical protein M1817_001358 [Caeruleum heppii]|nr:MAG: hypothetical protein M1817_001358 [Caeruleum heppii]